MATALDPPRSLGDLYERIAPLGDIPPHRIRLRPWPGEATEDDLIIPHRIPCELVDGILVEKAMGSPEGRLETRLIIWLGSFVLNHDLGIVLPASGMYRLFAGRVRLPDVSFVAWDRLPGREGPTHPIWDVAPNLAIEVLSPSNTSAEMLGKRHDYFAAGVELVWEVDPETRRVSVYTRADLPEAVLTVADAIEGGRVLPGFTVSVADLFAELDRHG